MDHPDFALYCDLDGVFADYDTGIENMGFHVERELRKELNRSGSGHPLKREMYDAVKGTDFYYQLPILPGAVEFYREFREIGPIIVTAAPKFGATEQDYFLNPYWLGAAYHKRRWMEERFLPRVFDTGDPEDIQLRIPLRDERYICTTSAKKQEFMHRKHSRMQVLVDDRPLNCENWNRAGGYAIQHNGDFNRTRIELLFYLRSCGV